MSTPYRRRPHLRAVIITLAVLTAALFAGGILYGAIRGPDRPCGSKAPVRERPGLLGQTEYLCPDGRTVTE